MGCHNSQQASDPLPPSPKMSNMAAVAPNIESLRTQNHFFEGKKLKIVSNQIKSHLKPSVKLIIIRGIYLRFGLVTDQRSLQNFCHNFFWRIFKAVYLNIFHDF